MWECLEEWDFTENVGERLLEFGMEFCFMRVRFCWRR